MGIENDDRRKATHSETLENTVAIASLTQIVSNLAKDTDRLVRHVEKILPIHAIISNLKNLLYAGLLVSSAFGTWITLEHFSMKEKLATFIAVQEERRVEASKERNYNKNQIQYLKGRVKP